MGISKSVINFIVLLSFINLFLFGCTGKGAINNDPPYEGYILSIENGIVLVAYDITEEKYKQIKNQSLREIDENKEYIPLIYLRYEDTNNLKEDDKVKVWIDDGVDDSYPSQATAKKIEVIN